MFGEMAIIEKQPRSATAVAVQPTRVLVLNEKLYDSMIGSNPDFARKMNKVLSERIRRADAIIQNIMTTNRQNQLWAGLVQYAREKGVATFKGSRVNIEEFTVWAVQHLGMTDKDVQGILAQFLKREVIAYSARGKDEILVELEGRGWSFPAEARVEQRAGGGCAARSTLLFQHVRDEVVQPRGRLAVLRCEDLPRLVREAFQAGKGFRARGQEALLRLEPVVALPVGVQRQESEPPALLLQRAEAEEPGQVLRTAPCRRTAKTNVRPSGHFSQTPSSVWR